MLHEFSHVISPYSMVAWAAHPLGQPHSTAVLPQQACRTQGGSRTGVFLHFHCCRFRSTPTGSPITWVTQREAVVEVGGMGH